LLQDIKTQFWVILFGVEKLATNVVAINNPDRDIFFDQKTGGGIQLEYYDQLIFFLNIVPVIEDGKPDTIHGKVSDRAINRSDVYFLA
jgi:hypothetical protein